MRVLYLLPDLGYHAAGTRVRRLVAALPRDRFTPHVAVLRSAGPSADFPVHDLGAGRPFDPRFLLRFRRLLADLRPDVVHAFRRPAVRLATLFKPIIPKLLTTDADHGGRPTAFDRWLFQLAGARGADLPPVAEPSAADPPPIPGPPADARLIVCVGALTPGHGFRDAVWAFDALRWVMPDLHLVLVGDGPERRRLEEFGWSIGGDDWRVHFVPARPDAAALLARAEVVWVPSRRPCGEQVAAEALAAGVPVVASNWPALAGVVGDAGLLVPPGEIAARVRATRTILDYPDRRRQMAEAAKVRGKQFSVAALVDRAVALYV
jgi:glycosyltransferase involved in cell wall biosynthesis